MSVLWQNSEAFTSGVDQMSDAVKQDMDGVVQLVDGEKINLTINGQTMNDIDIKGEDVPSIRENHVDYSRFEDLSDLFTSGLKQFAYFISRSVPEEFIKDDPVKQDIHSCRNGIKAMKVCIGLLENQVKTGETGYQKPHDYTQLHQWYVDGMIDFMYITMSDYPADLGDPEDDKYAIKCAITAFKRVRKDLLHYLNGLLNE